MMNVKQMARKTITRLIVLIIILAVVIAADISINMQNGNMPKTLEILYQFFPSINWFEVLHVL